MATQERNATTIVKPQRVLACVLCQQRKVKCDRKFPCSNCIKAGSHAQCVPAAVLPPRQRRRRFPERELLDRLRHYETLLRQNNIKFDPLHKDTSAKEKNSPVADSSAQSPGDDADESSSPSTIVKSESIDEAKDIWDAMYQRLGDSDDEGTDPLPEDVRDTVIKTAWDNWDQSNDHLLLGSRNPTIDLSVLHPEQIHIFRLWQLYLDNVNPLLKVTHTPTLQGRIIDAASNTSSVKPTLGALMFSIYCVAVMSLVEDECLIMFGSSKDQLLTRYQFGCQQALLKCEFLRSDDRECLTAYYLYLISVRPSTDPQSMSSMLGLAIRVAQRMGLDSEVSHAKYTPFEAEMRRRLWWSLTLFDVRMCDMAAFKAVILTPTWDCKIPLNVNDFDLQPEMKYPPSVHGQLTEAVFAVVRSDMAEFVRHCGFHLQFINPALKNSAKDVHHGPIPEGGEVVNLEKTIEERYLKFCKSENALQYMTIWHSRTYLAKKRLVEHFSKFPKNSTHKTDAQRNAGISYALDMLECDTKLLTSPLTKGYLWFIIFHFAFPAYIHLFQDLKTRPLHNHAERTWQIMSDNFQARFIHAGHENHAIFKVFAKLVLQAWDSYEAEASQVGNQHTTPRIVTETRERLAQITLEEQAANLEQSNDILSMSVDDFSMSMPMDFGVQDMFYGTGGHNYIGSDAGIIGQFPDISGQATQVLDVNQLDWNAMDLNSNPNTNLMNSRSW